MRISTRGALARTLGDRRRLALIATFMVIQGFGTGEYAEAVRFGQEALTIAQALGDRAIEVVATSYMTVRIATARLHSDTPDGPVYFCCHGCKDAFDAAR